MMNRELLLKSASFAIPTSQIKFQFIPAAELRRPSAGPASTMESESSADDRRTRSGFKLLVKGVGLSRRQVAAWLNDHPSSVTDEMSEMRKWTGKVCTYVFEHSSYRGITNYIPF
jgi:hypothetical protein